MKVSNPNTLQGWVDYAQTVHFRVVDMTIERVTKVFERLCPDLSNTCIIVVGGTNGKGSCVAMLESIYGQAGYSTAAFTSPHLVYFNERYRFNRNYLEDSEIINSFSKVEQLRENTPLTYFEFATLVAVDCLSQKKPDVLIMETGMGGRLDSVNILQPNCVLLTHVALDHTQWLGETREQIGFEKAGLFRRQVPAICADYSPPDTLLHYAKEIDARLMLINRDFYYSKKGEHWDWHGYGRTCLKLKDLPLPSIRGIGQIKNAAGVLMAIHCLFDRLPVSEKSIIAGIKGTSIEGRLQVIQFHQRALILDVAHNTDAVDVLNQYLNDHPAKGRTLAVFGMLEDKDIQDAISHVCLNIDQWLLTTLNVPRGASSEQLCEELLQVDQLVAYNCYPSPVAALNAAVCESTENDRIVVFGSFYIVGDVLSYLKY